LRINDFVPTDIPWHGVKVVRAWVDLRPEDAPGDRRYGYQEAGKPYVEFPGDQSLFINHSVARANIATVGDRMVATRDILPDEEILDNYREFESEPSELEGLNDL
jgi:hypothetical protein